MRRIARLNCSVMWRPSAELVSAVLHIWHCAAAASGQPRARTAPAATARRTPRSVRRMLEDVVGLRAGEEEQDERGDEDAARHHYGEVPPLVAQVHEVPADHHRL